MATRTLGTSTPSTLQHTVFFYLGLHCGVQEQYDLVPQQLIRVPSDISVYNESVYYQYTEFVSQHRFKDTDMRNKEVKTYAMPGSERCLVKLLYMYLMKLTPDSEHFFMRPLTKVPIDDGPWYTW